MAIEIVERTIPVDQLQVGMYVCRLDRPWEGTPFPLQGFAIENEDQLSQVRSLCAKVTIDEAGALRLVPDRLEILASAPAAATPARTPRMVFGPSYGKVAYADTASLLEELPRAREAQERLHAFIGEVLEDLRNGRKLSIVAIREAVAPIIESLLRSADAVFWLNALRKRSSYEYSHALNCTSLAVAFGRHLGFPKDKLLKLASGGLLLDAGKAQLPVELLVYPGPLDAAGQAQMRRHVQYSLEILEQSGERSFEVRSMIGSHHERHDGSGYPRGDRDSDIPIYGRIGGIVDAFDAMTSDRPYRKGIAHHEALQHLYRCRDQLFQAELVEQFIQCIGVYPTGSLVELTSGEVAIVMAQNRSRHLCPRVMVLTTPEKALADEFRELDLAAFDPDDKAATRVVHTLDPGAYGLDPTELYL